MTVLAPAEVTRLTRRGLRLAQFTVGYNVLEGILSIAAGVSAGLVSVIGFGFDSAIESAVAVLVGLRLAARLRKGEADERREKITLRFISITFFVLAAYVTVAGIHNLIVGEQPKTSTLGIVVLLTSLIVMPIVVALKMRVGKQLGDKLILADAAETRICVLLSLSTLIGLIAFALTGASWIDAVAGFVIALFAINEGREAWQGELVEEDEDDTAEVHA
ncbi:MAG: cation transporter [Ilumatobacteraceae bacterium]